MWDHCNRLLLPRLSSFVFLFLPLQACPTVAPTKRLLPSIKLIGPTYTKGSVLFLGVPHDPVPSPWVFLVTFLEGSGSCGGYLPVLLSLSPSTLLVDFPQLHVFSAVNLLVGFICNASLSRSSSDVWCLKYDWRGDSTSRSITAPQSSLNDVTFAIAPTQVRSPISFNGFVYIETTCRSFIINLTRPWWEGWVRGMTGGSLTGPVEMKMYWKVLTNSKPPRALVLLLMFTEVKSISGIIYFSKLKSAAIVACCCWQVYHYIPQDVHYQRLLEKSSPPKADFTLVGKQLFYRKYKILVLHLHYTMDDYINWFIHSLIHLFIHPYNYSLSIACVCNCIHVGGIRVRSSPERGKWMIWMNNPTGPNVLRERKRTNERTPRSR